MKFPFGCRFNLLSMKGKTQAPPSVVGQVVGNWFSLRSPMTPPCHSPPAPAVVLRTRHPEDSSLVSPVHPPHVATLLSGVTNVTWPLRGSGRAATVQS